MPKNTVFKNIAFLGIVFFGLFFLQQCGQRGTPTGGIIDKIPPKIKASFPENYSTNFKGKKITLKFDEYVQVKSFTTEFIISPPVASPPSYKLYGKKLILSFDSAFAENTTYTLFFGKAVVDLNEGNPLDSNLFVFSTGNFLDSLEFSGSIVDAFTKQPEENILVHLYKQHDDSVPKTKLPSYFAVAKNGQFSFKNLAAGTYKIFALQDANNNYLYDLPNEKIAFSEELITVPSDSSSVVLNSFLSAQNQQKIQKPFSSFTNSMVVPFSLSVENPYQIILFSDTLSRDSIVEVWNANKDSLTLYYKEFKSKNTYDLQVKTDTLVSDTFHIKISNKENKFSVTPNYSLRAFNNFNQALKLTANKPISSFCDSCFGIVLEEDTTWLSNNKLSEDKKTVHINYIAPPAAVFDLIMLPNAFTSILGEQTDSLNFGFKTEKQENVGNLLLSYDLKIDGNYILYLFQENIVVETIQTTGKKGKQAFKGLLPGSYQLKAVLDENKNKHWDAGNYDQQVLSEPVVLYGNEINIRANWDLELVWTIE